MSYKFPLAYNSWDHQEKEAIQNVIKDGFFTMGKKS
jgi:dTDP-4-amino-4,6-dideoxygalactose transaminase